MRLSGAVERKSLQHRFLIGLFSSWLVNPLWVALAHFLGYSSDIYLSVLLLGIGASLPFQLLLNEYLAVHAVKLPLIGQIILALPVALTQLPAIYWAVAPEASAPASEGYLLAVCLALTVANQASFLATVRYYRATVDGAVTLRAASLLGATPGLIYLLAYTTYFSFRSTSQEFPPECLALVACLPSLAQWQLTRVLYGSEKMGPFVPLSSNVLAAWPTVLVFAAVFAGLAHASTHLRSNATSLYPGFAAVLLVAMNMLGTIANTLLRAEALIRHGSDLTARMLMLALVCGIPAIGFGGSLWVDVLGVLSLQFLVLAALDFGRRRALVDLS